MARKLSVKHLQTDKNGFIRYRRRVPDYAKAFVGKSEFVKVLGKTENEALGNYGTYHRECEHLISLSKGGAISASPKVQEERIEALLRNMGADPFSSGKDENELAWRAAEVDNILFKYKEDPDTGRPVGISTDDALLLGALQSGVSSEKAEVTITDAFKFYLEENVIPNPFKRKKQVARIGRSERWLLKVINEDKILSKVDRRDARNLRDARLESGVLVGTVKREMNDIRAVFNCAISELDVVMDNPFVLLKMPKEAVSGLEQRKPLDLDVIRGVYDDLQGKELLSQIWTLLDLTGARLAEIASLRKNEFVLDRDIPHIVIQPSADRSLKNKWSKRNIPLIGEALVVAHKIVSKGNLEDYAFGKYGPVAAHDNLGAAFRKCIRKHTSDPKQVTHSLRHNMKDRLRAAEVFPETARAIQGHAYSVGQDATYGAGITLEKMQQALLKANP